MSEKTIEERVELLEIKVMALKAVIDGIIAMVKMQEKTNKDIMGILVMIAAKEFGTDVDGLMEMVMEEMKKEEEETERTLS